MATASAKEELEALEQMRSRLEAALSGDENWRALRQSGADIDDAADGAARRARNTRLEMALADNTLYQAWKHLNGAIDALRSRSMAQSESAEARVLPAPTGEEASGPSDLPEDIAALLRGNASEDAPTVVQHADAPPDPVAAVAPSPSANAGMRTGLVDRLERLDDSPEVESKSATRPDVEGSPRGQGWAAPSERQIHPAAADPPEATVTFVVRETRAPLLPSAELPSDLGTERNSALFERLRSLDPAPPPPGATYSPSDASDVEAEVTIITADGLRQRRETEERAGIVRRFRKALSGD